MRLTLAIIVLLISLPIFSQSLKVPENLYGIKNPQAENSKACDNCLQVIRSMPADVRYGISRKDNEIYFIMTDIRYLDKIFTKASDGIAVDIMSKDQYACSLKTARVAKSWAYKGYLMKPVYLKEMKRNWSVTQSGEVLIKVGEIPAELQGQELEFNLLLLNNKHLCYYNAFYDIPWEKWKLLDMGLYMDTVAPALQPTAKKENKPLTFSKKLKFEIPYEKNKSEYSETDIKPIYDSLKLNNYTIKSISIRAFASVEGSTERNIELQEARANSIIKGLQAFQIDTIQKQVHASENWVEFMEDIAGTANESMKNYSKEEIKEKLNNKQLSQELEPILKKHRKAIVEMELERKTRFSEEAYKEVNSEFEEAIEKKNLEAAIEIQQYIFSRIREHKLPSSFLDTMEIPESADYASLLNNKAAFLYELNQANIQGSIEQFEKLEKLIPGNKNFRYNIVALKLKLWEEVEMMIGNASPESLKSEIEDLEKKGFDKRLIKRMMINYHIILTEYHFLRKNYAEKDKAVKYIYNNYIQLKLSEEDVLNLAEYFAGYSKYDWAEGLLTKYVTKVDVKEDLLFYYLNLTIIKDKIVASRNYRTIMLNAINSNRDRFCKLFNPFGKGGITFQLLGNEYLRKAYCESCN